MFRDSHGVVHTVSSADPMLDLPLGAAKALVDALLLPGERDLDVALERCESVRELVERWQDAFFAGLPDEVDLDEEARWAADAGLSLAELEAGYADEPTEDDGEDDEAGLVSVDLDADLPPLDLALPDAEDDLALAVPEQLVAVLERELLLLPLRVRLEALVAAATLVGGWADLLADHEKLLGHLVLAHGRRAVPAAHAVLADEHAHLHAGGPGHPAEPARPPG